MSRGVNQRADGEETEKKGRLGTYSEHKKKNATKATGIDTHREKKKERQKKDMKLGKPEKKKGKTKTKQGCGCMTKEVQNQSLLWASHDGTKNNVGETKIVGQKTNRANGTSNWGEDWVS